MVKTKTITIIMFMFIILTSINVIATNYTITAINTWNSSSIINFTVNTVNGGNKNWTSNLSGIVTTDILTNYTGLINITYTDNILFQNIAYTNINVSNGSYQLTLTYVDTTQPNISCNINNNNTISNTNMNLNITITELYLTNTTINVEALVNETNNSKRTNYYYGNNNYSITNITSIGAYTINITAKDYNNNTANMLCNYTIIPNNANVQLYIYNYLNTSLISLISAYDEYTGETQTTNPFSKATTNYISKTTPYNLFNIDITDLTYYHVAQNISVNVTRFNSNFSASLTPNKLIINFTQNNAPYTTTGFVSDSQPSTRGFVNSSIIIIQQNLSLGKVSVVFNSFSNWTQYYEYINDYQTYITETLEIIPITNLWSGYIQVVDLSDAPIENAIIRAEYTIADNSTTKYGKLMGQRLTEADGYTFFIADKSSQILLTIYKDGYTPVEKLISFGDESFTRSNPIKIYLSQTNTLVKQSAWAQIPYEFTNRSKNIPIIVTSKDYSTVKIQTDYRNNTGLTIREVTNPTAFWGKHKFNLISGTDFNNTGTSDITLTIYLDNTYWSNYTIRYYSPQNITAVFPSKEIPELQTKIGAVIEFLGLLVMILIMGLLYKDSRASFHTFMGGTLILAIINPSYYIWLGFVGGIYYVYKIIYYIISE